MLIGEEAHNYKHMDLELGYSKEVLNMTGRLLAAQA